MSQAITDTIKLDEIVKKAKGHFHGGIHPEEFKDLSNQSEITSLELPEKLFIPVKQHAGSTGDLKVKVGDKVSTGQLLVEVNSLVSANIHSPLDGVVDSIDKAYAGHPSGLPTVVIKITVDQQQSLTREYLNKPIAWNLDNNIDQVQTRIEQSGIVGLGGATFPTQVKTNTKSIDTLIVNAMECEPYITCDDRMLKDLPDQVIEGAQIVAKLVGAKEIIFATEDNKADSIAVLQNQIKTSDFDLPMTIHVAPTKYPSGGEKQTIELVTGKQVPAGEIPASIGILVQNVATLYAVYDAVVNGEALYRRVVTLTGNLINKPGNYWIPFGTRIQDIMKTFHISEDECPRAILGGPLMGQSVSDFSAPVTKATNCIIFNKPSESDKLWLTQATSHQPCIRCGECDKACPVDLLPQQLLWFSQSDQWDNLEEQGLFDCIECGACAYVCPSEIPLVHYYRYGKSVIKQNKKNAVQSEKAKQRFDFREMRLAREKAERAAKHAKAAEAKRQAALAKQSEEENKQTAINEALERVKAKKAAMNESETNNQNNDSGETS